MDIWAVYARDKYSTILWCLNFCSINLLLQKMEQFYGAIVWRHFMACVCVLGIMYIILTPNTIFSNQIKVSYFTIETFTFVTPKIDSQISVHLGESIETTAVFEEKFKNLRWYTVRCAGSSASSLRPRCNVPNEKSDNCHSTKIDEKLSNLRPSLSNIEIDRTVWSTSGTGTYTYPHSEHILDTWLAIQRQPGPIVQSDNQTAVCNAIQYIENLYSTAIQKCPGALITRRNIQNLNNIKLCWMHVGREMS